MRVVLGWVAGCLLSLVSGLTGLVGFWLVGLRLCRACVEALNRIVKAQQGCVDRIIARFEESQRLLAEAIKLFEAE